MVTVVNPSSLGPTNQVGSPSHCSSRKPPFPGGISLSPDFRKPFCFSGLHSWPWPRVLEVCLFVPGMCSVFAILVCLLASLALLLQARRQHLFIRPFWRRQQIS